jgi:hypothetical protein
MRVGLAEQTAHFKGRLKRIITPVLVLVGDILQVKFQQPDTDWFVRVTTAHVAIQKIVVQQTGIVRNELVDDSEGHTGSAGVESRDSGGE